MEPFYHSTGHQAHTSCLKTGARDGFTTALAPVVAVGVHSQVMLPREGRLEFGEFFSAALLATLLRSEAEQNQKAQSVRLGACTWCCAVLQPLVQLSQQRTGKLKGVSKETGCFPAELSWRTEAAGQQ